MRELPAKREIRPREVTEMLLERIKRLTPNSTAFVTLTVERALGDADRLQKAPPEEIRNMPLYGVGYTIKDITLTKGIRTTFGSKNYENFVPSVDAEITIRMHNPGGILLGKTATLEFAVRPTTEPESHGIRHRLQGFEGRSFHSLAGTDIAENLSGAGLGQPHGLAGPS